MKYRDLLFGFNYILKYLWKKNISRIENKNESVKILSSSKIDDIYKYIPVNKINKLLYFALYHRKEKKKWSILIIEARKLANHFRRIRVTLPAIKVTTAKTTFVFNFTVQITRSSIKIEIVYPCPLPSPLKALQFHS